MYNMYLHSGGGSPACGRSRCSRSRRGARLRNIVDMCCFAVGGNTQTGDTNIAGWYFNVEISNLWKTGELATYSGLLVRCRAHLRAQAALDLKGWDSCVLSPAGT